MKAALAFGIALLAFMFSYVIETIGDINSLEYSQMIELSLVYFKLMAIVFTSLGFIVVIDRYKKDDKK